MPVVAIQEFHRHLKAGDGRLMAIDQGEKTLGLAMCNPEWTVATPFKTIARRKWADDMSALSHYVNEYGIRGFIIGLPRSLSGSDDNKRVQAVRSFGGRLVRETETLGFDPVITYWDERLSTSAVEKFLIGEVDLSRAKRDAAVDHLAALHILQGAMDYLRKTQNNPA